MAVEPFLGTRAQRAFIATGAHIVLLIFHSVTYLFATVTIRKKSVFGRNARHLDIVCRGYCGPRHHLCCISFGRFLSRYSPRADLTSFRLPNMSISPLATTRYVQPQMISFASGLTALRLFPVILRCLFSPSECTHWLSRTFVVDV